MRNMLSRGFVGTKNLRTAALHHYSDLDMLHVSPSSLSHCRWQGVTDATELNMRLVGSLDIGLQPARSNTIQCESLTNS